MTQSLLKAGAAAAALLGAAPAIAASPPPPPPSQVQIVNVQSGARTARFTVRFAPARIDATRVYPTYNFSVAPKLCMIEAPSGGAFRIQSYAGGPYQVTMECTCDRSYTASVATAPPDAYTPRSAWANSAALTVACQK